MPEVLASSGKCATEMLNSDGLLLFQASNCNHLIPAKVYEYLRARRPIFALTDLNGDTANLLRDSGIETIVPLGSKDDIAQGLMKFLGCIHQGFAAVVSDTQLAQYSRKSKTGELAKLLDSLGCDYS